MTALGVQWVELEAGGERVRIEYEWIAAPEANAPLLVFLHEGLGSRSMWKDFPAQLCAACGFRGLVYSRPGYGRSTPRQPNERWGVDFMHQQAQQVLPQLLAALGVAQPPWLFGHSDGASIALLHAAHVGRSVAGLVVLAPHVLVEALTLSSIEQARRAYESTDLPSKLARYHDDADSAFWGWNQVWLDPAFRGWNIESELAQIQVPVLAIQGLDDEYGTLEHLRSIVQRVPGAQSLTLPECGHSPHRDQAARVMAATVAFVGGKAV